MADLAAMLLSNITTSLAVSSRAVNIKIPVYFEPRIYPPFSRAVTSPWPENLPETGPEENLALPLLVDAFVDGAAHDTLDNGKREGSLHFLSSFFANVTVVGEN